MRKNIKKIIGGVICIGLLLLCSLIYLVTRRMDGDPKTYAFGATIASLNNLAMAVENFRKNCSRYPLTSEGLQFLISEVTPGICEKYRKHEYLTHVPLDEWDNEFKYESDGRNFKIWTTGYGETFVVKNGVKAYRQ